MFDYSKPRCYYSCPYAVMRKLDAIIRVHMMLCESSMLLFVSVCCYSNPRCYYICVHMLLCESSMLLFVSVCCYAKPRCYYSCFELCSSSDPGLQRARPLWSSASDKLIMPILPAERKFMLLSMAEVARKLSSNI